MKTKTYYNKKVKQGPFTLSLKVHRSKLGCIVFTPQLTQAEVCSEISEPNEPSVVCSFSREFMSWEDERCAPHAGYLQQYLQEVTKTFSDLLKSVAEDGRKMKEYLLKEGYCEAEANAHEKLADSALKLKERLTSGNLLVVPDELFDDDRE